MCIKIIERYALCRCICKSHAVDACPAYGRGGHEVKTREILVGDTCSRYGKAFSCLSPFDKILGGKQAEWSHSDPILQEASSQVCKPLYEPVYHTVGNQRVYGSTFNGSLGSFRRDHDANLVVGTRESYTEALGSFVFNFATVLDEHVGAWAPAAARACPTDYMPETLARLLEQYTDHLQADAQSTLQGEAVMLIWRHRHQVSGALAEWWRSRSWLQRPLSPSLHSKMLN